jgi:AAA domain
MYLRDARGYDGVLPHTLRFLPAAGDFPPAMIAAFGIPEEPEPGVLAISANEIRGVHLTRLKPDGSGKAGTERDKIMLGSSSGWPVVLAPASDLLAKLGKSWMALDICLAVAGDRLCLGERKPTQGAVLYAAMEDNPRRMQRRIDKLLRVFGAKWPAQQSGIR